MARDERLPKEIDQATESMGLALHEAGLMTPGEARQWIEETKDHLASVEHCYGCHHGLLREQ